MFPVEYDDPEQTPARTRVKRKVGDAGLEIADSDDEYGWDPEDEENLPPEPSQWQGSEDLIVGTQRSDDESEDADEGVEEGVGEGGVDKEGVDEEGVEEGGGEGGVDKEKVDEEVVGEEGLDKGKGASPEACA